MLNSYQLSAVSSQLVPFRRAVRRSRG